MEVNEVKISLVAGELVRSSGCDGIFLHDAEFVMLDDPEACALLEAGWGNGRAESRRERRVRVGCCCLLEREL